MSTFHDLLAVAMSTRTQRAQQGVDVMLWAPPRQFAGLAHRVAEVSELLGLGCLLVEVRGDPLLPRDESPRIPGGVPVLEIDATELEHLPALVRPQSVLLFDADRLDDGRRWRALQERLAALRQGQLSTHPLVVLAGRARPLPGFVDHCLHLEARDTLPPAAGAPLLSIDTLAAQELREPVGARTRRLTVQRDDLLRDHQRILMEWLSTEEPHACRPGFTHLASLARPSREQCHNAAALAATAQVLGADDTLLLRGTVGRADQLQRFRRAYLAGSTTPPRQRELLT